MATAVGKIPHRWYMTFDTYTEFVEIKEEIQSAQQDHDELRLQIATDRLRSLPFHPGPIPDNYYIQPVISLDPAHDYNQKVYSVPNKALLH